MAESTLSLNYGEYRSRIGYHLGYGRSFRAGNIAINTSGVVTLSATNRLVPSWAATGSLIYGDAIYTVNTRDSNTQFTLNDTSWSAVSATANFALVPWSEEEMDDINETLDSGLAQFYNPPPLPGERNSHDWSFLHPKTTITIWGDIATDSSITITYGSYDSANDQTTATASGGTRFYPSMVDATFQAYNNASTPVATNTYTVKSYTSATVIVLAGNASGETDSTVYSFTSTGDYRLPDDHAGFIGKLHYDEADNSYYSLEVTGLGSILSARQQNIGSVSSASRPLLAAEQPKSSDGSTGQRSTLSIWPIPNGIYTMHYQYHAIQNALTDQDYPMGGQAHAETILESCLAVGESRIEDQQGNHSSAFIRLLTASVSRDRRAFAAQNLGYNADRSDGRAGRRRYHTPVTYEGVEYFGS